MCVVMFVHVFHYVPGKLGYLTQNSVTRVVQPATVQDQILPLNLQA